MKIDEKNHQNKYTKKGHQKIAYRIIRSWEESEIIDLYRASGWWEIGWSSSKISPLIRGSFLFMIALDTSKNQAIGMGRIISDGFSDGYIQDVAVLHNYQDHGIGTTIVTMLRCFGKALGLSWIGLISAPGKENIYKRSGFSPMENYIPMNLDQE